MLAIRILWQKTEKPLMTYQGDSVAGRMFEPQTFSTDDRVMKATVCQFNVPNGMHACGIISALAAHAMLTGKIENNGQLDDCITEGIRAYPITQKTILAMDWMTEELKADKLSDGNLSIDEIFVEGGSVAQLLNRSDKVYNATLVKDTNPKETFAELLAPLKSKAITTTATTAALVTIGSETYAVGYNPTTDEWMYFNSHGTDLSLYVDVVSGQNPPAVLCVYKSLDSLTELIATRKFWVEDSRERSLLNQCALYLVEKKS